MSQKLHKTKIDIPENARGAVVAVLNARLADAVDLASQMKQAHWNVKGPNFIALHEMFDTFTAKSRCMSTISLNGSRHWAEPPSALRRLLSKIQGSRPIRWMRRAVRNMSRRSPRRWQRLARPCGVPSMRRPRSAMPIPKTCSPGSQEISTRNSGLSKPISRRLPDRFQYGRNGGVFPAVSICLCFWKARFRRRR